MRCWLRVVQASGRALERTPRVVTVDSQWDTKETREVEDRITERHARLVRRNNSRPGLFAFWTGQLEGRTNCPYVRQSVLQSIRPRGGPHGTEARLGALGRGRMKRVARATERRRAPACRGRGRVKQSGEIGAPSDWEVVSWVISAWVRGA